MKKIIFSIMILQITLIYLSATSLWRNQNPYGDNNAHKIGDIITIIINESAVGSTKTEAERQKEIGIGGKSGSTEDGKTFFNSFAKLIPLFGAEASGKSKYKANADEQKVGKLVAKISVIIKDITPEGNLILEGEKDVKINNEKQKIVVKGVARPNDITSDNTILSDKIANAEIVYTGKLAFGDEKRPGLIKRTFNSVFGFLF